MSVVLFDLACAEEDRRFSPFCWRTRLALAHKGLDVDARPWRFVEKDAIAMSGQGKVPVILDGDKVVFDSWAIAQYLEAAYPDRPSLFGGGGSAPYDFIRTWADGELMPAVARMVMTDMHAHLHEKDKAYFREAREKVFGTTLEQVCAGREERVTDFRARLGPLRRHLAAHPFVGGEGPDHADYIIASILLMARSISPFPLLAADDVVAAWGERILDLHGGLARRSLGYASSWGAETAA